LHAFLTYTTALVDQVLISSGQIRTSFRIMFAIQVMSIIAVLIFAAYGLVWVAAGIAMVGVVQVCIYQIVGQQLLQVPFAAFIGIYSKNILVTLMTTAPSLVAIVAFGNASSTSIPTVAGIALATGFSWLLAIWLLKSPLLGELATVLSHIKTLGRPSTSEGPTR
jgi:hypothetical protein